MIQTYEHQVAEEDEFAIIELTEEEILQVAGGGARRN